MERGGFRLDERERARFEAGLPARRPPSFDNNNQQQQQPAPVVPHLAEKYDPDHPDADWGGFVQRSYKKRFFNDHSSAKDVRRSPAWSPPRVRELTRCRAR